MSSEAGTPALRPAVAKRSWLARVRAPQSAFLRHVLVLLGGTAIAQAIPIAILPLLTRLYAPDDFGLLALYTTLVGVIAVIATARYEFAILLPATEAGAVTVVALAVGTAAVLSSIALIVAVVAGPPIAAALGNPPFAPWLIAVAIAIFLNGALQALGYFANRRKAFSTLARSKVAQTGTTGALNLAAGLAHASAGGLILGTMAGTAAGAAWLYREARPRLRTARRAVTIRRLAALARRYRDFPRFYAPGALCDNASAAAPIVALTHVYGVAMAGFFGLTTRIVAGPAGIISTSVGQVLFQRMVEANNAGQPLLPLLLRSAVRLAGLALVPLAILGLAGPWLFGTVFGAPWVVAGRMAQIMAVGFAVKFVVSPLSIVFTVLNRVKLGSAWQFAYLGTTTLVLLATMHRSVMQMIGWWTVNEAVAYVMYFVLMLHAARQATAVLGRATPATPEVR